ncbi:MAG: hypothetical protein E7425_10570 [Ruminococcaceae bacterium]|nr:hypothetical protein [Oscillospiraceae bacterium]
MKKKADEALQHLTKVLPVAWVLTCYDLGARWPFEQPMRGLLVLFASCAITMLLLYLGAAFVDETGEKSRSPVVMLLILLGLLLVVTALYTSATVALPADVI